MITHLLRLTLQAVSHGGRVSRLAQQHYSGSYKNAYNTLFAITA